VVEVPNQPAKIVFVNEIAEERPMDIPSIGLFSELPCMLEIL